MKTSQIRCKKAPTCTGVMGAWNGGEFLPAGHLKVGRDLWFDAEGHCHLRCPMCSTEHVLRKELAQMVLAKVETIA